MAGLSACGAGANVAKWPDFGRGERGRGAVWKCGQMAGFGLEEMWPNGRVSDRLTQVLNVAKWPDLQDWGEPLKASRVGRRRDPAAT